MPGDRGLQGWAVALEEHWPGVWAQERGQSSCPKASKRPTADPQALTFPGRVPGHTFPASYLAESSREQARWWGLLSPPIPTGQSSTCPLPVCGHTPRCPGSQPPALGGSLLLSPETRGSRIGQRGRSRRGEELGGRPGQGQGMQDWPWGCHCPQQLHLRAPAWASSPSLIQREVPRTSHQLLLL